MTEQTATDTTSQEEVKRGGKRTAIQLSEGQLTQIVTMRFTGATTTEIAKVMGISRQSVDNILKKDKALALTKEMQDALVADAKLSAKADIARLTDKAIKALERALEEGDISAVKLHFTALGLLEKQEEKQNDTNLTIVLPGQAPEPKEVENDTVV